MWFLALGINIQHRDHYYSWEYHVKRGDGSWAGDGEGGAGAAKARLRQVCAG